MIVEINIEKGTFFYGTLKEWEDCFFEGTDVESIKSFCLRLGLHGYIKTTEGTITITPEEKVGINY